MSSFVLRVRSKLIAYWSVGQMSIVYAHNGLSVLAFRFHLSARYQNENNGIFNLCASNSLLGLFYVLSRDEK